MRTFSSFREFVRLYEAEMPIIPPNSGIEPPDPGMWENPSYQRFWLASNRDALAKIQGTAPQIGQKAVARVLPPMQRSPVVRQLPDPSTLNRNHPLVAGNISIALSPAGAATYPFYWSERDKKVKPNPSFKR